MESGSAALGYAPLREPAGVHHDHEHPPEANRSSRVDAQFLGMLLFIISEVMLFGAFFTAYFFIRAVAGAEWPAPGEQLPVAIAGVNTAVLVSSSFTMHWALGSAKAENRAGMRAGLLTTFLLGATFLTIQINEYVHLGFGPATNAQGTIFFGLTGLHGAHVFVGLILLSFATIRAFRGHFTAKEHRGVEVPGIYWHFVDVMWIIVYSTVYIL
ncbi:MAG TPA: cytochrome c oxidase subunit 3 [Thermoleophilaceae bacterium]|nr:cytochrome c oxidase subunit 3 [Thermoleophilaceae bacterium]